MGKLRRGFPSVFRVTLVARFSELPPVLIDMTGETRRCQSQICRVPFRKEFEDVCRRHAAVHVARVTLDARVLAQKRIAGGPMIERPTIKMNNLEISSMVLAVAFGTLFPDHRRVESLPGLHPHGNLAVTSEAAIVRKGLPDGMALRTVFHSFERSVPSRKVPRRYL